MRSEIRKMYFCEYCRKHYIHPGHAKRHEKFCKKNPNNKHKCFWCKHLLYEKGYWDCYDGDMGVFCQGVFTCKKTEKEMFSYKAEKSQYIALDGERMPLECEDFEDKTKSL